MIHKQRFTLEKIKQRLQLIVPAVYARQVDLPPFRYQALDSPTAVPPIAADIDDTDWPLIQPHTYWGRWMTDFVLRSSFTVPTDWETDTAVALYLPLGNAGDFSHPEALAYIDGHAHAACDRHHQEIRLAPAWQDGQPHTLALHGWTGLGGTFRGDSDTQLFMRPCRLVQIHQPARDFITTARVALETAEQLLADDPVRGHLLNALDDAFKLLDTRHPLADAFYASIPAAHQQLQAQIARAGRPLDVTVYAAGHAHIDVAWLWTLGQTRRKAERTFHTVIRYMEQFPEFHFTQSQPHLYDTIRQDQPELFARIQRRVADGRWEPIGGMWVEADCNLSGAESLARQFLLGRAFFRRHFGPDADSPILWLPDVFGYAWNLPQLIKEAGLDYFFTIKISWNQYNRLPVDSFWWQGLDGTRVLTHFSPTKEKGDHTAATYNAKADPAEILSTWTNFQQKEQTQTVLMAYGYGDGGGGPTREMLENLQEIRASTDQQRTGFPGLPQVRPAKVLDFFRALEREAGDRLPVWNGELYLEYHRGTYTSQSGNKRANRKSEFLLHDAEFLATATAVISQTQSPPTPYPYPQATLNRAWELVCLNQFHDIIPGSSITPVYIESQQQYEEIRQLGEQVRDEALAALARLLTTKVLLINPTSFSQHALLFVPDPDNMPEAAQSISGGYLLDPGPLPPYSVQPLSAAAATSPVSLSISSRHLENQFLRVDLDEAGDITRLWDKAHGRDILPPGSVANQFQAFEDRPQNWDAWDIDIYYDDRLTLAEPAHSIRVVESGPLRATLEIKRRILHSDFVQRISLGHHSPRLDFHTIIDWQERHTLLKVAFPVDVLSPTAAFEVQWGQVERPTHRNTSWDWAKFETCAHKWVDLSQGDYGLSLLNDCKYGHDVQDHAPNGGTMRLSLLRGATSPDPSADLGTHEFIYSLWPHHGRVGTTTIAQAYALNDPPFAFVSSAVSSTAEENPPRAIPPSFIHTDQENVVIETIKQAEDGRGLIVRLYESQRMGGPVTISTGFPLAAAWRTNLLEENQQALAITEMGVHLTIRPFQIITLRLLPRQE